MRSLSLGGAWVTATYGGRIEMDMQRACREIINEVDGSLGCIVIDTQTGLTVAAESRPGAALNATMVDLLSIISTNMFSGQMVRRFEEALDRTAASDGSFVREVQMTTAQTNQFMSAIPGWNGGLLVLITDKSVSLGLGWMALHRVVKQLGAPTQAPSQVADAPPAAAGAGGSPSQSRCSPRVQPGGFGAPAAAPADHCVGTAVGGSKNAVSSAGCGGPLLAAAQGRRKPALAACSEEPFRSAASTTRPGGGGAPARRRCSAAGGAVASGGGIVLTGSSG